jgi:putative ABC transport system permease protein
VTLASALRVALSSLRRQPAHTAAMVLALGVGVAAWTAASAVVREATWDPLSGAASLHMISVDEAPVAPAGSERAPARPPARAASRSTYRDRVLLESAHPVRKTDFFGAFAAGSADGAPLAPVEVVFTTRDFFAILDAPFASGGAWGADEGMGGERSVVLTEQAERALFPRRDGLGKTLRLFGAPFRVVGVVAPKRAPGARAGRAPVVFAPSAVAIALGVRPVTFIEHGDASGTYEAFLRSENRWLDLWVQFDGEAQRAAFQAELDAHVARERARGRRISEGRLVPWARVHAARTEDAGSVLFTLLTYLVLAACALDVARMLEGKGRAKRAETSICRAFGQSARSVLVELVLEAELVAVAAALLGLSIAAVALAVVNRVIRLRPVDYHLDARAAAAALAAALLIGLLIGAYQGLRAAAVPPARGLGRS